MLLSLVILSQYITYFVNISDESNEEIRYIYKLQGRKKYDGSWTYRSVIRIAQSWFNCFQVGNFDVKDATRCGQPITDKADAILICDSLFKCNETVAFLTISGDKKWITSS